ncbi:MAG: N-acetylmuramoyl-L-alanine amidase [Chitinophagales bacterium]|nr:N-acetylmuramoyl-L-alanine amidase [Chitinophagales bacterium]
MVKTINLLKNNIFIHTFSVIIIVFLSSNILKAENYNIKTVVIDAGHGGHDSGAIGPTGIQEKMVALQVALKLGEKIKRAYPDIKVIYTRKTDVFIKLYERSDIANKNHADLFISVHCNSATNRTAMGTETFVLGLHRTNEQFEVAKRENSVISLENNTEDMYGGFDPNAPETMIMLSLNLNAYLEQSMLFASKVQDEYTYRNKRQNRGVKQIGLAVLAGATMPGVLTEIGFISNPSEEKYISSDSGQEEISNAILDAFTNYKKAVENGPSGIVQPTRIETENTSPTTSPITSTNTGSDTETVTTTQSTTSTTPIATNDVNYKIQIAVTSKRLNINQHPYSKIKSLEYETVSNMYKYLAGGFKTFSSAQSELQKIKGLGFHDAFIVVYKNGKRLGTSEAKEYLQ